MNRQPNRAERRKARTLTRKAVALIDAGRVTEAEVLCVRQGLSAEIVVAVLKRRAEILAAKHDRVRPTTEEAIAAMKAWREEAGELGDAMAEPMDAETLMALTEGRLQGDAMICAKKGER